MSSYRVLVANITTNVIISELPFDGFSYEEIINGAGKFSGTLDLRNPKVTQQDLYPMRNSLYVERDGIIVWSGMVTTCSPNSSSGTLKVDGLGLWSYAGFRLLNESRNYLTLDQTSVITQGLMTYMNEQYNIGWVLDCPASGVLRDRQTYYGYERRTIRLLIEQLSNVINGFDFAVQSSWSGNEIVDTFRTFYPERGRRTNLKWTKYVDGQPGSNVDIISAPINGVDTANKVASIGDGQGEAMRNVDVSDVSLIGPDKYPLIETVTMHKTIRHSVTLTDRARQDLQRLKNPPVQASLVLRRGHSDTAIGVFEPGDLITLTASDGWVTLSGFWKILSYQVDVDSNGSEEVTAKVIKVYE